MGRSASPVPKPMAGSDDKSAGKKPEAAASPPKFTSRFSSHFAELYKSDSDYQLLICVCAFAGAAESFNTVVTPSFSLKGYDVTGTFCNLMGALLGGLALKLSDLGPNATALSNAFRGGFVGAFTSFCFMVEESATLQCARSSRALQFFVFKVICGPFMFAVGSNIGSKLLPILGAIQGKEASKESPEAGTKRWLDRGRYAMASFITVAIAMEWKKGGSEAAIELVFGVAFTMAACIAGEAVAVLVEYLIDFETTVNWGTIIGNVVALSLLSIAELSKAHAPANHWVLLLAAAKYRGCFCAMLSGYGAFCEDVAGMLASSRFETAATNIGMNALVGIVFMAVLEHASCGK